MGSPDSREINFVRCLKCFKILTCSRYDTSALLDHIRTDHPEIDIIDTDTKQRRSPPPIKRHNNTSLHNSKDPNELDDQIREYRDADEDFIAPYKEHTVHYESNENEQNERHNSHRQPQFVKDIDLNKHCETSELLKQYPEIKESEYCPHNPNAQVIYTRRYKLNSPSGTASTDLQSPAKRTKYYTSVEKWRPGAGKIYCPKCGVTKKPLIKSKVERFTNNDCGACCLLSCWPFCFIPWLIPGNNVEYLHCANCRTFLGLYNPTTNCIKPNRLYIPTGQDGHCVIRNRTSFENIRKSHHHKKEKEKEENEKEKENETEISKSSGPPHLNSGAETYNSSTTNSSRLPCITINGKTLPPETVARLQKYKKYSSMLGINLDEYTDNESPTNKRDRDDVKDKAPSDANRDKDKRNSI